MADPQKSLFEFRVYKRVYQFVKPYRSYFYLAMFLSLLLAALSPVRGLFIQFTIDKGLKNDASRIPAWLNHWFDSISQNDAVKFIVLISVLQIGRHAHDCVHPVYYVLDRLAINTYLPDSFPFYGQCHLVFQGKCK